MIIILDDSFEERHKFSDVNFLKEKKYGSICKIIEKPMRKDFKNIVNKFENIQLLCSHRSLRLFNKERDVIDSSNDAIQNLSNEADSKGISRIVFGRDMHSNYRAGTLDKDRFYENLQAFLDNFIETDEMELKILYYGKNFKEIENLNAINNMMDSIGLTENINNLKNDDTVLEGLAIMFPNEKDRNIIIEEWISKGLTQRQIITLLNDKIE